MYVERANDVYFNCDARILPHQYVGIYVEHTYRASSINEIIIGWTCSSS